MTEGEITKYLVGYSIPLTLGNIFQLTYSAVNSIIAGRFIGREVLVAEGTASPVMNIVILGTSDICMGASVLMSESYGAGQKEKPKWEVSAAVIFGCYFSMLIAILGGFFSEPLLGVLGVPDKILGEATSYLSIIFLSAPFTYLYNVVSAALKSVGDSKMPLKFSAFSSILNTVLDLILIGGMGFGAVYSAVTAVVTEAASAFPCITYVYRKISILQLGRGEFNMDRQLLR